MGVLASTDRACLAGFCEGFAEFSKLCALVKRLGYAQAIDTGVVRAKNAAALRFLRFAGELALTPAARSKVEVDPQFKESTTGKGRFFHRGAREA
jgi:phage terminase small subunit